MQYFIGIDGGATKTHCIITDQNLEKLYECYGGPSNFLMLGTEKVSETIFLLIEKCASYLNINFNEIISVVIGTTGAGRKSDAERLENSFKEFLKEKNLILNDFYVDNDARIALEAAFSGKPGSIIIAGTGSIMFGKDANGNIHRVGGFGRFIGDEGSGYMLGKKGLMSVAKNFDGRGETTLLTELVFNKFNICNPENLITEIYKNNFDIASVAPLVLDAANSGDKIALKIVEDETDDLILHIRAMKKKISEKILYVSLIGGIISNKNIYSEMLKEKVAQNLKDVVIKMPDNSPAFGAILIASERAVNQNKN